MKWALVFLPLLITTPALAQEFNAGFIDGLWFSKETIFANELTRVYVAIRNNTGADLSGRVEFYADDRLIGRNNVSALDGRIIESWADWTPTYGEHTITASLSRTELSIVGSTTKSVEVRSALAEEKLFVDYDTDNDGVGNRDDRDDDGDGMSDETEVANGTDPLVFDDSTEEVDGDDGDETGEDDAGGSFAAARHEPTGQAGFEAYLTPSPAHTALASISELALTTKQNLDTYRQKRADASASRETATTVSVNDDGFGEIVRSDDEMPESTLMLTEQKGFIASVVSMISTVFNVIYTAILKTLSLFLGYLMFVQLTLLLAILFVIYKLARKFGARPR